MSGYAEHYNTIGQKVRYSDGYCVGIIYLKKIEIQLIDEEYKFLSQSQVTVESGACNNYGTECTVIKTIEKKHCFQQNEIKFIDQYYISL